MAGPELGDPEGSSAEHRGGAKEAVRSPDVHIAWAWMGCGKTGTVDDPTPPPAHSALMAVATPEWAVAVTRDAGAGLDGGIRARRPAGRTGDRRDDRAAAGDVPLVSANLPHDL